MRLVVFISILFLSSLAIAQDMSMEGIEAQEKVFKKKPVKEMNLEWMTSLEKAKAVARRSKKPILVYFSGSDWCTPCKKLEKQFFKTEAFQKVSQKYHLVYLDNPYRDDIISEKEKKENKKIADKFKVKFPTVIALDYKGVERNRVERFSGNDTRYHWKFMEDNEKIFRL